MHGFVIPSAHRVKYEEGRNSILKLRELRAGETSEEAHVNDRVIAGPGRRKKTQ